MAPITMVFTARSLGRVPEQAHASPFPFFVMSANYILNELQRFVKIHIQGMIRYV